MAASTMQGCEVSRIWRDVLWALISHSHDKVLTPDVGVVIESTHILLFSKSWFGLLLNNKQKINTISTSNRRIRTLIWLQLVLWKIVCPSAFVNTCSPVLNQKAHHAYRRHFPIGPLTQKSLVTRFKIVMCPFYQSSTLKGKHSRVHFTTYFHLFSISFIGKSVSAIQNKHTSSVLHTTSWILHSFNN